MRTNQYRNTFADIFTIHQTHPRARECLLLMIMSSDADFQVLHM